MVDPQRRDRETLILGQLIHGQESFIFSFMAQKVMKVRRSGLAARGFIFDPVQKVSSTAYEYHTSRVPSLHEPMAWVASRMSLLGTCGIGVILCLHNILRTRLVRASACARFLAVNLENIDVGVVFAFRVATRRMQRARCELAPSEDLVDKAERRLGTPDVDRASCRDYSSSSASSFVL
jgi:hypothetical protein